MPADSAGHSDLILETMARCHIEPTLRNYIQLAYLGSKSVEQVIHDGEEQLCALIDLVQTGQLHDFDGALDVYRENSDPV
jgi:hypothetical protein